MTPATCVEPVAKQRDRIDLRIDPKIRARIDRQAERFGLDLSDYIRQAIVEKLERDEATDPERDDD